MRVEDFILAQASPQKQLLLVCHEWLIQEYGLTAKIRHGIPFYFQSHWVCYLNPIKQERVELAFLRARELSNQHKVLDFKKRKMVAGVTLIEQDRVDWELLGNVLKEAIALDKNSAYRLKHRFNPE